MTKKTELEKNLFGKKTRNLKNFTTKTKKKQKIILIINKKQTKAA